MGAIFIVPTQLKTLAEYLWEVAHQSIYIVGGAVRDLLSGQEPHDLDLASALMPEQITQLLDKCDLLGSSDYEIKVVPTGIAFGTISIVFMPYKTGAPVVFQHTTFREDMTSGRHPAVCFSDNLAMDLSRRDFTVNSMALEIVGPELDLGNVIDLFFGRRDLSQRALRAVGVPQERFREDPLRMVRACRFAGYGEHGFVIEPLTMEAMKECARLVEDVSKERIALELQAMLRTPKPSRCFKMLEASGLLPNVCPPLIECIGLVQEKHCGETVFEHLLAACDAIPSWWSALRLAALLHDVGKPATYADTESGIHFYNHEIIGASIAYKYMRDFKLPNALIKYIVQLIRRHMFMFSTNTRSPAIKRFLQQVGGYRNACDLVLLRMADRKGNKAKEGKHLMTSEMRELVKTMYDIVHTKQPLQIRDLEIDGNDIQVEGVAPGPKIGKLLRTLLAEVIDEKLLNNRQALLLRVCELVAPPTNNSLILLDSNSGKSS